MSHPFCATEKAGGQTAWPELGFNSWNGKAIYVRTIIDPSVTHPQAAGEAIYRWNEAVGSRFYLTPDSGDVTLTLYEREPNEWPFKEWLLHGSAAGGFCLNFDASGRMLGILPGRIVKSEVYVNRRGFSAHREWVNVFAHEIGHAFGLADHPGDDINSVMSYQFQGRILYGPSSDDEKGIAAIYSLRTLDVSPQDLDGIENIENIWHLDRYAEQTTHWGNRPAWTFFLPGYHQNSLARLIPGETYLVRAKQDGMLGFGRFSQPVYFWPHARPWVYL